MPHKDLRCYAPLALSASGHSGNPKLQQFHHSYCFKTILADATASVLMTCFSPAADSMLPTINELLPYLDDPNPYVFPDIRDLENTRHVFQLHFGTESRTRYPEFILDHALDGSAPLPPTITAIEGEGESSSVREPEAQEVVHTELTVSAVTPPPGTDEPAEKVTRPTEPVSEATRKELTHKAISSRT